MYWSSLCQSSVSVTKNSRYRKLNFLHDMQRHGYVFNIFLITLQLRYVPNNTRHLNWVHFLTYVVKKVVIFLKKYPKIVTWTSLSLLHMLEQQPMTAFFSDSKHECRVSSAPDCINICVIHWLGIKIENSVFTIAETNLTWQILLWQQNNCQVNSFDI